MNITGTISHQNNNLGSFYIITTDDGLEFVISMTESTSQANDNRVLGPFVNKKVNAVGIFQKSTNSFLAFDIRNA